MLLGRCSTESLPNCGGTQQGARSRRVSGASRVLSALQGGASSNFARVEEVLQKKLRKKGGRGCGREKHRGPQHRQGTEREEKLPEVHEQHEERDSEALTDAELLSFERHGHLSLKGVLSETQVLIAKGAAENAIRERSLEALRHRIRVLLPHRQIQVTSEQQALQHLKAAHKELGFLQHFNLHRYDKAIRELVLESNLTSIAAQLLNSRKLRLYQDCVFLKQPGFTQTHWHSDCPISPLDTSAFVTAWIPLRPIKGKGDSGLNFAQGSHRDVSAHFHRTRRDADLSQRGYPIGFVGRMELGDVSWHHGWLLHHAPPQPQGSTARMALAVSYFQDGARVVEQQSEDDKEDRESFDAWCGAGHGKLAPGQLARHALLPLVHC